MNDNPIMLNLVEEILDICEPEKIILFSTKYNLSHEMTSFKLCVIVSDNSDINELEAQIYLELECESPFDVVIYKSSVWEELVDDDSSFASKVSRTGVVLYEL